METDLDLQFVFDEREQEFVSELETDSIGVLFSTECEYVPEESYVKKCKSKEMLISVRMEAISLISKASRLDPFVMYLAVNYLDRFLSRQEIPGKAWISRLVAVSCVSLAIKMRGEELSLSEFQRDGVIFDAQTIRRMELLILGVLNWKMRSITPFSFINCFLSFFEIEDPPLISQLRVRAIEIVLTAQTAKNVKLLEFRPSVIAAASLLCASREIAPLLSSGYLTAVSHCFHVNQELLLRCNDMLQDIVVIEKHPDGITTAAAVSLLSREDTPVGVLDHRHISLSSCSESDGGAGGVNNTTTTTTCSVVGGVDNVYQSQQTTTVLKRQKLNHSCCKMSRISRVRHC